MEGSPPNTLLELGGLAGTPAWGGERQPHLTTAFSTCVCTTPALFVFILHGKREHINISSQLLLGEALPTEWNQIISGSEDPGGWPDDNSRLSSRSWDLELLLAMAHVPTFALPPSTLAAEGHASWFSTL